MGLQDTGAGGIIYIIVGRAGKTGRKQTSSWLVRLFLSSFPHRADARCFLSGIAGQEDAPREQQQFILQFTGRGKLDGNRRQAGL